MERWTIYWQDVACIAAGTWLMVSVGAQITSATLYLGALAYLTGALIVLMSFAGFTDRAPGISWTIAIAGLVAAAAPVITGQLDDLAAMLSFFVCGAVAVIFGSWSALRKRQSEERPSEREASATSSATTTTA
ncbi:MAG: SPW repeat domain-containing protein [Persicimonas sp.]